MRNGFHKLLFNWKKSRRKTLTLKIRGGLGNQLFQLLALEKLAAHSNRVPRVDIAWYNHEANTNSDLITRRFELSNFSDEIQITESPERYLEVYKWIERITRKTPLIGRLLFGCFFEPSDSSKIMSSKRQNINIFGYWIDGRNFPASNLKVKNQVSKYIEDRSQLDMADEIFKLVGREDVAVLHIRGSDYLKFQNLFINLQASYYFNAIDKIEHFRKIYLTEILVLTDDVSHAQEVLKAISKPTRQISEILDTDHFGTLLLMSQTKNLICSNSTFSWWGAFLNSVIDAKIVFPKSYMVGADSESVFSSIDNCEFLN